MSIIPGASATVCFGLVFVFSQFINARAAEIKVVSATGARAIVSELALQFERKTGHKLQIHYAGNAEWKPRIAAGETFDVAIVNPSLVDELIKQQKIVADTRSDIARSGLGMAVRAGAPKPDISSVEAFKRALLAAKSISYSPGGASGIYFMELLDRLRLAEEIRPKLKPMAPADTIEAVARGEAEVVVVVVSPILAVPGVELVDKLPVELQTYIGYTAGIGSAAKEPEAARALIKFLTSPEVAPIMKAKGMEPG